MNLNLLIDAPITDIDNLDITSISTWKASVPSQEHAKEKHGDLMTSSFVYDQFILIHWLYTMFQKMSCLILNLKMYKMLCVNLQKK